MGLLDLSWGGGSSSSSSSSSTNQSNKNNGRGSRGVDYNLEIENEIGSGSYGIVHLCHLLPNDAAVNDASDNNTPKKSDDENQHVKKMKIAKRAWTEEELINLSRTAAAKRSLTSSAESIDTIDFDKIKEQLERCRYYIDVERNCLDKLASLSSDDDDDYGNNNNANDVKKYVPNLIGVYPDNESNEWLVFDIISPDGSRTTTTTTTTSSSSGPVVPIVAPTLSDILAKDWIDQHEQDEQDDPTDPTKAAAPTYHHLYVLQKAFGMKDEMATTTFGDVLDKVFVELLRAVSAVNSNNIVHRDVKPGNLLVHSGVGMENNGDGNDDDGSGGAGSFILIDFGSGKYISKV